MERRGAHAAPRLLEVSEGVGFGLSLTFDHHPFLETGLRVVVFSRGPRMPRRNLGREVDFLAAELVKFAEAFERLAKEVRQMNRERYVEPRPQRRPEPKKKVKCA